MNTSFRSDKTFRRVPIRALASFCVFSLCGFASAPIAGLVHAAEPLPAKQLKTSELFTTTNLYTVHLKFTPEQWEEMEPKGGGGFFGGRGGGPGGRGGGFGPGMFLAPAFLNQGDGNKDGKLSKEEFHALGEKWFTAWDKEKSGKLNNDQIRDGLNASMGPQGGAGVGRGGRGPGMNLQGAEGKRNGLSSAAGVEFKYVHADLEFDGRTFKDVAVRYKGNGTFMQSRGSLKRSFKIDLNQFNKGQQLAGISKINLHNGVTDASWMNEVLSHRLFRDAGVPASRTAYARVYVTVPGKHDRTYFGVYSLVENVDNTFAQERFGTKHGAIFKPVTRNPFEDLGDDWAKYNQTYDPKTKLTPAQKKRVIDFAKLVSHADDKEFAAKLPEFVDLDEFARFMAVTVWVSTLDSILTIGQNYVVYLHPQTQKFQFFPWDLDHSFGQFGMMGGQEQRENLSINHPWQGDNRFLERVFKVDAFKKLYLAKMTEFSKTIFKPERFIQQVDEIAAVLRPAVKDESEDKLTRFDKVVSGEPVPPAGFGGDRFAGSPRNGGPEGGTRPSGRGNDDGPRFGPPGGFAAAKPIKGFVTARAIAVNDQLAGKSEGQELGGFGFGGGGGPGGRRGGPGGGGFGGPGNFVAGGFVTALDADKNGEVSKTEFINGFDKWFTAWNTDNSGLLTDEQLRNGINQDLSPFRGGPPGGGPVVVPLPNRQAPQP